MGVIIDFFRERIDQARANMQPQSTKVTYFKNEPQKHPTPALFGADPNSGDFEDWASYRTPKLNGPGAQPLQTEMKEYDSDVDKWKGPNPNLPSLTSHGKKLDYSRGTDQRPIKSFHGEMSDKPITLQVEKKKDFQSVRKTSEPTVGDQHALDLKKYPFDFSF